MTAVVQADAPVAVAEESTPVTKNGVAELGEENLEVAEPLSTGDVGLQSENSPVTLEQPQLEVAAEFPSESVQPDSEADGAPPEGGLAQSISMRPRPQPRRKVIAFPASSYVQQEAMRRLADPVQPEQLRILDVPEELQAIPSTPFLDGLLDAPASPVHAQHDERLDLPSARVGNSRRAGASLIDAVAVLAAMALFAAAASRFMSHDLPPVKFLLASALGISALLWASYQYLFLVFGGRTLGMQLTHIGLRTFKGRPLSFNQRQSRVMALYLSVLSMGMGVLWSLVDVDGLCWHDRISQTFPTPDGKP